MLEIITALGRLILLILGFGLKVIIAFGIVVFLLLWLLFL